MPHGFYKLDFISNGYSLMGLCTHIPTRPSSMHHLFSIGPERSVFTSPEEGLPAAVIYVLIAMSKQKHAWFSLHIQFSVNVVDIR